MYYTRIFRKFDTKQTKNNNMKKLNYLVQANDTIQEINKRMENGEGRNNEGLQEIADKVGLSFWVVKTYIESF